jgi:adenine-specific DNA-methyltransferase
VASGSLDKLLLKDAQSKRLRIPVDKSFLLDMTGWREEVAKDLYKRNPDINVRMLNEVVQRILDRFVFIRIAEDRKIVEPKSLLELVELWKREGKRRPLQYHLNILFRQINADLNGEIFKSHAARSMSSIQVFWQ